MLISQLWIFMEKLLVKNGYRYFLMALTCVVGTHTHVPTADTRILEKAQLTKLILECVETIIQL